MTSATGPKTDAPLRIVHCFRDAIGGVSRHVTDLAEAQARRGHSVGVICDSTTGGPLEDATFERIRPMLALGLLRLPIGRRAAPSDIAVTYRLTREVRSLNPDVLHAHGAKGGVYVRTIGTLLRASGSRVARIYSPHGGSLHYDPKTNSGRIYIGAERALARLTDALIFVSQYEADTYAAKVGRLNKPSAIIRNGLAPAEFMPVTPDPDARDFLFIGELRDVKGPDVFIEALARLKQETGKATSAVLVGSGPDLPRYEARVKSAGLADRVIFRDRMPTREAFALARAVVVPSRAESMPYTVLEAAAAAMPMVASRVGGIPEIFGEDGDRLVLPGDSVALAAAMRQLGDRPDLTKAVTVRLRKRVQEQFSVEAMADAVIGVYRSVSARR